MAELERSKLKAKGQKAEGAKRRKMGQSLRERDPWGYRPLPVSVFPNSVVHDGGSQDREQLSRGRSLIQAIAGQCLFPNSVVHDGGPRTEGNCPGAAVRLAVRLCEMG